MNIQTKRVVSPKGDITLYTLTNASGASVTLSSLGAGIVSIVVPDSEGTMADVALGYKNPVDYFGDGPCAGKTPGRYANRICKGRFSLDGKEYSLAINNGPNALHGGPEGFMNRIWKSEAAGSHVKFTYNAADGEEGYPGAVKATVIYSWNEKNELTIEFKAESDAKTVINLTNHAYFNLDGENSGSVLDHELQLFASKYLPTDSTQIPTGELADVKDTPMDFLQPKTIGRDINADFEALKIGKGYDHCWVLDNWHKHSLGKAAVLTAAKSGRVLEVLTTQPGAQVYSGNWLGGCPESKSGRPYNDYDGVAIECQGFPDAPNHRNFPCQLLCPGEEYNQTIVYRFTTK
ncbi:MAG TPA: aldose epimerase family protein [Muribaculum sp.]|uniref:Aldose 1-epimerase n=1 Tax=Heminiphilus faecis TaxID=2601703 RepID=A0ABV4D0I9_9BACT|nr:aldose epimerase family protein [Heminiphilus faecis]RLT76830.1 galactose mutarotase [bacterium J10(2018)]HRF68196.1 aldose epimerase family protein [Muribaculum sp.]